MASDRRAFSFSCFLRLTRRIYTFFLHRFYTTGHVWATGGINSLSVHLRNSRSHICSDKNAKKTSWKAAKPHGSIFVFVLLQCDRTICRTDLDFNATGYLRRKSLQYCAFKLSQGCILRLCQDGHNKFRLVKLNRMEPTVSATRVVLCARLFSWFILHSNAPRCGRR